MEQNDRIIVSICCITYNHVQYIRKCLDGFLMQECNFQFEILIHDDCSTDGTDAVIREYEVKYPSKIFPLYETENMYQKGYAGKMDDTFNIPRAKGKYIAICEGDDYWTDPLKLQKQVNILEANESLMACCTNCSVVDMKGNVLEEKRIQPVVKDNKQGSYSLRDFFDQGHQYPTLSVVYRNAHREEVRQKTTTMRNPYMGDWTLWIALLYFGDMYYLDEVTCAYRINPTSLTHDQSKYNQRRLGQAKDNFRLMPLVASCLPDDYQDKKNELINDTAWMWYKLAIAYKHVGQYFRMAYALLRCELKDPGFVRRERSRK